MESNQLTLNKEVKIYNVVVCFCPQDGTQRRDGTLRLNRSSIQINLLILMARTLNWLMSSLSTQLHNHF